MRPIIELENLGLQEISNVEAANINGGLLWLLVNAAVIGTFVAAGAAIYASAEAGYNQACGCN